MMFGTACKKDSKTPQELVLGKWNLKTYEWKEVYQGVSDGETEDRSADNDYIEFRTDGMLYIKMEGSMDTISYEVVSAKQLKWAGQTIDVSTLNEKNLSLYFKETDPDYTFERWYNFAK